MGNLLPTGRESADMRLYLDTADPDRAAGVADTGLLDGVTTNPSLVAGTDRPYETVVRSLADTVDGDVFAQVLAEDPDGMVREGRTYDGWAEGLRVKLPATRAGLTALSALRADGIDAGVTVVFTVRQALLAAKNDATFVAPYVGRLTDAGVDGVGVVEDVQAAVDGYGFETEVLAASVRTGRQVDRLLAAGIDAMTLAPELLESCFEHPKTAAGLEGFRADWGDRPDPV